MIVLGNRCINLCSEKFILDWIAIAVMCPEQLKCFPVSSSRRFLWSLNPNLCRIPHFFGMIFFYCFLPILHFWSQNMSQNQHNDKIFQENYVENGYHIKHKTYGSLGDKKELGTDLVVAKWSMIYLISNNGFCRAASGFAKGLLIWTNKPKLFKKKLWTLTNKIAQPKS